MRSIFRVQEAIAVTGSVCVLGGIYYVFLGKERVERGLQSSGPRLVTLRGLLESEAAAAALGSAPVGPPKVSPGGSK